MKRSQSIQLVLMGTVPLLLSACDGRATAQTPQQSTLAYQDLKQCVSDGKVSTDICEKAYADAVQAQYRDGPRYSTLGDLQNFIKLAYMTPELHHSGGVICEPVDVPVPKRHLEIVYSHIRYSDKPFMGMVTAPNRAEDTVRLAEILFGADFVDRNAVLTSVLNCNSPMVWDATMLGALAIYARANQAVLVTPFIMAGAMSPAATAGSIAQLNAEVTAGIAYAQLVRPGAPMVYGCFVTTVSMLSGAPMMGTPEPSMIGKTTSHGCVRLTNWDALVVASFARPGTPVIFAE